MAGVALALVEARGAEDSAAEEATGGVAGVTAGMAGVTAEARGSEASSAEEATGVSAAEASAAEEATVVALAGPAGVPLNVTDLCGE